MATIFEFDQELDELERTQGGRGLRHKLEETLSEVSGLKGELATYKAAELLKGEGLSLVKPEDLAGVTDPKQMKAKAEAIQKDRIEAQRILAKDLFAKQGLEGDELETAVETLFASPSGQSVDKDSFNRLTQTVKATGSPTPATNLNDLHGTDAIVYGLTHGKGKSLLSQ
jgi:hypothetical protein